MKASGWKLGVITNSSHSTAHKVAWFQKMGLDLEFDVISNSCEVGFSKPHPKIYEYALEKLKISGENSYFVGHTQKVSSLPFTLSEN